MSIHERNVLEQGTHVVRLVNYLCLPVWSSELLINLNMNEVDKSVSQISDDPKKNCQSLPA